MAIIQFLQAGTRPSPEGGLRAIDPVGSGRFCGVPPEKELIQQPDHPRNDGGIGQVEHVPGEFEAFRVDVEQDEVHHRPIGEAVDGVAERPADDQAERQRRQFRLRPREPDPQDHHRTGLQRQQRVAAEIRVLREQAVADARIPGEHEGEERREVDQPLLARSKENISHSFTA